MRGEGDGGIGSSTGRAVVKQEGGREGEEGAGNGLSDGEDEGVIVEDLVKEWSNRLGPKYQVKVYIN